ncbi:uncharacterized protein ACOB8E_025276 isoform 1-T1 [Sarcophilus harrisii]
MACDAASRTPRAAGAAEAAEAGEGFGWRSGGLRAKPGLDAPGTRKPGPRGGAERLPSPSQLSSANPTGKEESLGGNSVALGTDAWRSCSLGRWAGALSTAPRRKQFPRTLLRKEERKYVQLILLQPLSGMEEDPIRNPSSES